MLVIESQPKNHILEAIRQGRAFLVLGAGASKTSKNRFNNDVLLGSGLAKLLCKEAGIAFSGEPLKTVLSATVPTIVSEGRFHEILREQFQNIRPSPELTALLQYSWKRLYTWNIDDSIEAVKSPVQRRKPYNGMVDKANTDNGIEILPVIQLHGDAGKPEHGFIFTESDYNKRLISGSHYWYLQLAQDYVGSVPIFIGSQLEEPILSAELDRARPTQGAALGQAYLISPDPLTPIQELSFKSRQIIYLKGTLSDFTDFLQSELGASYGPIAIASAISAFAAATVNVRNINASTAVLATFIYQHRLSATLSESAQYSSEVKDAASRNFLEGAPPGWRYSPTARSLP